MSAVKKHPEPLFALLLSLARRSEIFVIALTSKMGTLMERKGEVQGMYPLHALKTDGELSKLKLNAIKMLIHRRLKARRYEGSFLSSSSLY